MGKGLLYTWWSPHIFIPHLKSVPYHWQLICQVQDARSGPQRMFHSMACFAETPVLLISPPWEGREETGRFSSPLFGSFILSCINMESPNMLQTPLLASRGSDWLKHVS